MIVTQDEVMIHAPAQRIYDLASRTVSWPQILPHYRFVRETGGDAAARTVEMSAWRSFIPVRWTARQWNEPDVPRIRFNHIAGWARGMDVEWQFEPVAGGTRVRIVHALAFRFPFAADFFGKYVVGGFFVHHIAGKTLRRIKELAERE